MLAALSLLGLALLGQVPEEVGGWLRQPVVAAGGGQERWRAEPGRKGRAPWRVLAC